MPMTAEQERAAVVACTLWRNEIERTPCTLPHGHDGACMFEYGALQPPPE